MDKYETVIAVDFTTKPDSPTATPMFSLLAPLLLLLPLAAMWLQKKLNN